MNETGKNRFISVLVEFYSTDRGGRINPINLNGKGYRPHFRIKNKSEYLGVEFINGPIDPIHPGESTKAMVKLIYFPKVNYEELKNNAEFDILEGPNVVGTGKIIEE